MQSLTLRDLMFQVLYWMA